MGEDQKPTDDKVIQLLTEVRDEFRAFRTTHAEHNKPKKNWYEREPAKTILAHGITVCVAVVLGYMVHECTGAPVTIEASAGKPPTESESASAASAIPAPVIEATAAAEEPTSVVAAAPPLTTATSAPAKSFRQQKVVPAATNLAEQQRFKALEEAYAMRVPAHPPAAPASAAPMPSDSARALVPPSVEDDLK